MRKACLTPARRRRARRRRPARRRRLAQRPRALVARRAVLPGPRRYELQGDDRAAALDADVPGPARRRPARASTPSAPATRPGSTYNAQFYERRAHPPARGRRARARRRRPRAARPLARRLRRRRAGDLRRCCCCASGCRSPAPVPLATVALPALVHHSSFPLTDSWGLALETAALACGLLALERGRRWLIPWAALILLLSLHARQHVDARARRRLARAHVAVEGLRSGCSARPSPRRCRRCSSFTVPMRELLAQMLNDAAAATRTRPGASIASPTTPARSSTCCRPTAASSATARGSRRPTCSAAWRAVPARARRRGGRRRPRS